MDDLPEIATEQDTGELPAAKLTALWALSEGGLGGILHATRLPLRGVILACIAAVSICLISRVSQKRTAALRAAVVVIAIKAVLAPHSVGGASVAVLNQALLGTLGMLLLGPTLIGCVTVGVLALLETSLHHLVWATLLGGMDFWASLDELLIRGQEWLAGEVLIKQPARWMVSIYVGIHVVFGAVSGFIAWRLPRVAGRILTRHAGLASSDVEAGGPPPDRKKRSAGRRWLRSARGMIFVIAVVALAGTGLAAAGSGAWYWRALIATGRILCVVGVFVFVVRPLVGFAVGRLRRRGREYGHFSDSLASVRALQTEAGVIWRLGSGMRVWHRIVHTIAVLFASALVDGETHNAAKTSE